MASKKGRKKTKRLKKAKNLDKTLNLQVTPYGRLK
jgi:hypothetical protein